MSVKDLEERFGVEIDILKKLGMRWAVLVSLSNFLHSCPPPYEVPQSVDTELRLARSMIESGCFSVCEVDCMLTNIERELIPKVFSIDEKSDNRWVHLLGKAMKGELTSEEVLKLPFIEPIIQECEFMQCICGKEKKLGIS